MLEYLISILLPITSLLALSPGAGPHADNPERHYICASGIEFSVRFARDHAVVFTRGHRYKLEPRRLSVGIRYGSDNVAFAQDDNRAVLIGAADGPYRDCVERPASPVA